jgi:hypothetical protein
VFSAPAGTFLFPRSFDREREKGAIASKAFSGDERDTESNWADTDSMIGSDASDVDVIDVD